MASPDSDVETPQGTPTMSSPADKLIVLNAGSQLCIKLDGDNYPAWRIQFMADVRAFLLIYIDDLLLTGNNTSFLNQFMTKLSKKISLKQLGFPHYFLGIELILIKTGLFLSQHGYIRDLLHKFNMAGAKTTTTPLCMTTPPQVRGWISSC